MTAPTLSHASHAGRRASDGHRPGPVTQRTSRHAPQWAAVPVGPAPRSPYTNPMRGKGVAPIVADAERLLASAFQAPTPTDFKGRTVLCWILERGRGAPVFLTLDRSARAAIAVLLDGAEPELLRPVVLRDPDEVWSLIMYLRCLVDSGLSA